MQVILVDTSGEKPVLRVGEAPSPQLEPGALRLRVAATAVNRADLLQARGLYPPPPGASEILGLECSGEVLEVGEGVTGWSPGDRAMALLSGGGYASEVVVDAGSALPVPDAWSLEAAAAVPEVFLTVFLNVFQLAALPEAGSVLVHGGGSGIGTATIQLVRAAGGRTIVTAGSEEKCARCRELGADVAVNYNDGDFLDACREATVGVGVDVVLDSIGAPYLGQNLASLAVGGRLVLIGLMGGAKSEINLGLLLTKRLSVIGSTLRARPVEEKARIVAAFAERFGAALESGTIGPVVDRVLPLAEAEQAHRVVEASRHFGKVVLSISS
ncbi:MAG: NAD(P)H-quinone oxidoreductase [Deltaproteobacteria bacterium]|nr:NAD(P)H-quinone oxidoreductase [Deltaproteobacteria bacterium]